MSQLLPINYYRWLFALAGAAAVGFVVGVWLTGSMAAPVLLKGVDTPTWVERARSWVNWGVVVAAIAAVGWLWSDYELNANTK